jgi:hypothetical protein
MIRFFQAIQNRLYLQHVTRIPFIFKMKFYLYSPRTALRPVATAQQILQMAFRYLRTMALWKR